MRLQIGLRLRMGFWVLTVAEAVPVVGALDVDFDGAFQGAVL